MNPSEILKPIFPIVAALFLCSCQTTSLHYLAQPERLATQGGYVHPASQIALPENVGSFKRDTILRYDSNGLDISAGYNLVSASHRVAATIYVYPAPSLISIGSPAEVVAGARAQLTENEFARRKQEIQHVHPGAMLIEQRDTVRTERGQSYPGKLAIFEYEELFAGSRMAVRSRLYVFCYVGGKWAVEYRFTYPKDQDAEGVIQEFIQNLSWYGTGA
jgi:hypothetical protein